MKCPFLILILAVSSLTCASLYAEELARLEKRLSHCDEIINEIMVMPDESIPKELLSKCAAVAIFPYVFKGGFFAGARFGKGVLIAHNPNLGTWKAPAFFTICGGSFGFQFGAQSIDLVLVIKNKRGLEALLKDNLTLGGGISVAAGPIGRNFSLDTDLLLKAGILSYSRSKGLFAGAAVKGAVLIADKKANHTYYGGPVHVDEIVLGDKIIPPASSRKLLESLNKFSR